MTRLGNGLHEAERHDEALSVREADLAMMRRLGASEESILATQSNLAGSYSQLGRPEALRMLRDVYCGRLKIDGEEHDFTLMAANNYANSLLLLGRFEEAKSLLRKAVPVARRVLGEGDSTTLRMRKSYALALYKDPAATLDDLREAVTTLEDTARIARRVLGGVHPLTGGIESALERSREALHSSKGTA